MFLQGCLYGVVGVIVTRVQNGLYCVFYSFYRLLNDYVRFSTSRVVVGNVANRLLGSHARVASTRSSLYYYLFQLRVFFCVFVYVRSRSYGRVSVLYFVYLRAYLVRIFFPLFRPFRRKVRKEWK